MITPRRAREDEGFVAESKKSRTVGGLLVNAIGILAYSSFVPADYGGLQVNAAGPTSLVHAVLNPDLDHGPIYGHLAGQELDTEKVRAGRQKERDNHTKFEVYRRVPVASNRQEGEGEVAQ